MQALSDEQKVESLEKKIDKGFAEMRAQITSSERTLRGEINGVRGEIAGARSEARSDFRTLIALTFGLWGTTILCFVGVLLQHHV
jgi:hypothetical protein